MLSRWDPVFFRVLVLQVKSSTKLGTRSRDVAVAKTSRVVEADLGLFSWEKRPRIGQPAAVKCCQDSCQEQPEQSISSVDHTCAHQPPTTSPGEATVQGGGFSDRGGIGP